MSERCKYIKRGYCSVRAKIVTQRECERCKLNNKDNERRDERRKED